MSPSARSRLESHLRFRIGRRYQTISEKVHIGPVQIDFTRIKEPDRVLDEVAEEEDRREKLRGTRTPGDELHLPYWAELWDSSHGIGRFMVDRAGEFRDRTVLDLGCGMGLSGAVASALGNRVLLVDLEPAALLLARLNTLDWIEQVRLRRIDWRRDHLAERFAVIIGSDVLYERAQWEFLERFWREHLAPSGTILLAEPGRQTGDMFRDWIGGRGWQLKCFEQPVPTRPLPIRIFQLSETADERR